MNGIMMTLAEAPAVVSGAGLGVALTKLPNILNRTGLVKMPPFVDTEHPELQQDTSSQLKKLQGLICIGFAIPSTISMSQKPLLAIGIMLASALLGELVNIHGKSCAMIEALSKKVLPKDMANDPTLAKNLIDATLISISGSLSVFASVDLATTGDPSKMYLKLALDVIGSCILAASGSVIAILLSAIPITAYQVCWYLAGGVMAPYADDLVVSMVSGIGGVILINIGLQLFGIDTKIKSANYIPAFVIPFALAALGII